jgi:hypothetical protein
MVEPWCLLVAGCAAMHRSHHHVVRAVLAPSPVRLRHPLAKCSSGIQQRPLLLVDDGMVWQPLQALKQIWTYLRLLMLGSFWVIRCANNTVGSRRRMESPTAASLDLVSLAEDFGSWSRQ